MKKRNLMLLSSLMLCSCNQNAKLPRPEVEAGIRGEMFGIDKNINEKTIDNYLNREDSVYRDVRMLIDPANYENIQGDSYLSGYVEGFEIVPFPFVAPVTGLPEAVGEGYTGDTLFSFDGTNYQANYQESMLILETLFPKDKNIFLMCGGGGYAGMMRNFLLSLGWNIDKIYNVGGYWYYNGNHSVNVKRVDEKGEIHYDFWKIPYHDIDFAKLEAI